MDREKRTKQINTTVTESELDRLNRHVGSVRTSANDWNYHRSEFIREAILEKLAREETPEKAA